MKTHYYCQLCKSDFYEDKIANLNRIHFLCGSPARIVKFEANLNLEDFQNDQAESPPSELEEYQRIKKWHNL